jgi:hypothetical protein
MAKTNIGYCIILSYQNHFWFGIFSEWNGKVFIQNPPLFSPNIVVANDGNNLKIFNAFSNNLYKM